MKVVYSEKSLEVFETLDLRLQRVCRYLKDVLAIDHTLLEGFRDEETQNKYYNATPQITKLKWPKSKHNTYPSKAVDIVPYIRIDGRKGGIHWHDNDPSIRERYYLEMIRFSTIFKTVALLVYNLDITSGIDWDNDWSIMDTKFMDLPHQEINE